MCESSNKHPFSNVYDSLINVTPRVVSPRVVDNARFKNTFLFDYVYYFVVLLCLLFDSRV